MTALLVVLATWLVGNFLGWLTVQDLYRPWNWRALVWIPLYYRWLDSGRRA